MSTYDGPSAECLKIYSAVPFSGFDENGVRVGRAGADDPGQRLDELARAYQHQFPQYDYVECWQRVVADPEHASLVQQYAAVGYAGTPAPKFYSRDSQVDQSERVGTDIDEAVQKYMSEFNESDYGVALDAVLKMLPPHARKKYAEVRDA